MSPTSTAFMTSYSVHLSNKYVNSNPKRLSFSSDLSDEEQETRKSFDVYHQHNTSYWNQLLAQFDSQPDMLQLIELCKAEEDRRRQEETKMKLKEYEVWRQLQHMQAKKSFENNQVFSLKEFNLHLPPLSS
ncbi:MAG: hypothetical protein EXX96DRAFT_553861 [Benjaminiella poitrasii]|nr:MAG: hypothetical protein EXX96DRAFT_553861 [Benjaminiella poitrasii]